MKLTFMAAAAAALAMTACTAKQTTGTTETATPQTDKQEVYTGVLPSADAAGIQYTLTLDYDADNNYTEGDYTLVETTLDYDSVSAAGYKNGQSFTSKGDFTVENPTTATNGKKYLKLVQDDATTGPIYFLVDSDTAITMVGADLQPAVTPGMNYTLTVQK